MSGDLRARNNRTLVVLVALPLGVALFALFAFRPLYQLWCRATGTAVRPNVAVASSESGRVIEVLFQAKAFDGLPVRFWSDADRQQVRIGQDAMNTYHLENLSDRTIRIRPIHQVAPINAAKCFGMKVCFCFNDQEVEPRGRRDYPVVYAFDPALDPRVETVTLCYSLFDIAPGAPRSAEMERIEREVRDQGAIVSPKGPHAR